MPGGWAKHKNHRNKLPAADRRVQLAKAEARADDAAALAWRRRFRLWVLAFGGWNVPFLRACALRGYGASALIYALPLPLLFVTRRATRRPWSKFLTGDVTRNWLALRTLACLLYAHHELLLRLRDAARAPRDVR